MCGAVGSILRRIVVASAGGGFGGNIGIVASGFSSLTNSSFVWVSFWWSNDSRSTPGFFVVVGHVHHWRTYPSRIVVFVCIQSCNLSIVAILDSLNFIIVVFTSKLVYSRIFMSIVITPAILLYPSTVVGLLSEASSIGLQCVVPLYIITWLITRKLVWPRDV